MTCLQYRFVVMAGENCNFYFIFARYLAIITHYQGRSHLFSKYHSGDFKVSK